MVEQCSSFALDHSRPGRIAFGSEFDLDSGIPFSVAIVISKLL